MTTTEIVLVIVGYLLIGFIAAVILTVFDPDDVEGSTMVFFGWPLMLAAAVPLGLIWSVGWLIDWTADRIRGD